MPSPKELEIVLNEIGKGFANYYYFFSKLQSPDWIMPLKERKFFSNPPDDDKHWPESEYLSRMAEKAPQVVKDTISQIPYTTNQTVHRDIAVSALSIPASNKPFFLDLVYCEISWIKGQSKIHYPLARKYSEILDKLITYDEDNIALELMDALLEILPDPSEKDNIKSELGSPYRPEPQIRIDDLFYEEIIKNQYRTLTEKIGTKGLNVLCDKLQRFIKLSRIQDDEDLYETNTYVWRPAVEYETHYHTGEVGDTLVTSLNDICLHLIEKDSSNLSLIISYLRGRESQIFDRLILFLLSQFPGQLPEDVNSALTDKNLFDDVAFLHEYALLLNASFSKLPRNSRVEILNWVEEGPNKQKFKEYFRDDFNRDPSNEDITEHTERWQRTKLALFKKHLKGKWKIRYLELIKKYGEPEHPDLAWYTSIGWAGPTSPKTIEELKIMTTDEIVEFLKTWKLKKGFKESSPEGLSRMISTLARNEPISLSSGAAKFENLDPTYVRGLVVGLTESLKEDQFQDKRFDWESVLKLCQWVITQPIEIKGRDKAEFEYDPDWTWTRKEIGRLLENGFECKTARIPIELRDAVWKVLRPLTDDRSPSGYAMKEEDPAFDYVTASINMVRGVAVHSLIRYGLWLRRHYEEDRKTNDIGFNIMPEVREILEKHLDTNVDPSLVIRSVYGQWFPWIILLDKTWAVSSISKVFPEEESLVKYKTVAWDAYISYCSPFDDVFDVLRKQYSDAVASIAQDKKRKNRPDPDENLARHLMAFYWRGKASFEDPLFRDFWYKADDSLRASAVGFAGRVLCDMGRDASQEVLGRLKEFWTSRVETARAGKAEDYAKEMSAFGWWFVSEKFDTVWALDMLEESLKVSNDAEHEKEVLELLSRLSSEYPQKTLSCLNEILRGDKQGWSIHYWKEEAKNILRNALRSDDPIIIADAHTVIGHLRSRLFTDEFAEFEEA